MSAIRLMGNRVLLRALSDRQESSSGSRLIIPNHHKKPNLKFVVVAVGPGVWWKNPRTKKKKWVTPEVVPGWEVLSRHWLDAGAHPDWHQPQYYGDIGAEGCSEVICDARFIEMIWQIEPKMA